jgi:septum formation protein
MALGRLVRSSTELFRIRRPWFGVSSGPMSECPITQSRLDKPLVLASASPRRIALLREEGFDPEVEPADIDDGALQLGPIDARDVAPALAHFKARRVADRRAARGARPAWILAADTVCERDGRVLGKPRDRLDARAMISSLVDRGHGVVTGWCLLGPTGSVRVGRDIAWIEIGRLPDALLDAYLDQGLWQGKAGGYNLPEVVAAGWPIRCEGDPQTVIGLPVRRLAPILRRALASLDEREARA